MIQIFRLIKVIHLLSLVSFLGSILTFIFISTMIDDAPMSEVHAGRKFIAEGTAGLTMPALWAMILTGLISGYKKFGFRSRFFQIKAGAAALLLINAYLFIIPSVNEATEIALRSADILPVEYSAAYMKESLFGAANVILTITTIMIAVWKNDQVQ
ncbi:MAG: hypothetical protein OEZ34_06430 [Spirochaetia bacterium]|nr:hypothetical protein [Spirochaetia bacterium]